jgi:quinohemoprotein ethanol dehydrogenase
MAPGMAGSRAAQNVVAVIVFVLCVAIPTSVAVAFTDGGSSFGGGSGAASSERSITLAPAFSPSQLATAPTLNWITNGGSTSNQRYSPLAQITPANVKNLKGVWMTHLGGSATAAKYSAESQPIVYRGVIYVATGADDVFAVDAHTGEILWTYHANLSQEITTVCCGWLSRGVAIGAGHVYIGQLDGKLVALDQQTGTVDWSVAVGHWNQGYTITAAPLYYDGMVITGVSGGEFSIRGRVQAYDAKTGKLRWRFFTIPGPGQAGHTSWPAGDAWTHGGAPVWQTPAVDPKLGLIYFSTGNASPDLDGSGRAGDDLFAASIVALHVKTGRYAWHFQEVHHDIWDYDAPSPVVLFDARIGGRIRHGIAETGKTGWTYLLDRATGKPLLPIPERPVPQDQAQRTSATQPIPSYPPFVPHQVSTKGYREVVKTVRANANGKPPGTIIRAHDIYTPFDQGVTVATPGPQGGTNWQPMSYNPKTGRFYICAQSGVSGYTRSGKLLPEGKQGKQADIGSVLTLTGFGNQVGYFGAVDAATGRIAWQKRWPDSCYAGTMTTGGGLVFVGRSGGQLQAYDARSGDQLWSFQTGAGANDAPSAFAMDGKEYIVFYAGGNSLAASPHGDNLWLFSLDGTKGPAAAPGAGQGVGHAGEAPSEPTNQTGDAAAGQTIFQDNCSTCHGSNGQGGNGGPNLTAIASAKQLQRVIAQVTNGGGGMPAFRGTLTDQQIADVAAYVVQRITHGH